MAWRRKIGGRYRPENILRPGIVSIRKATPLQAGDQAAPEALQRSPVLSAGRPERVRRPGLIAQLMLLFGVAPPAQPVRPLREKPRVVRRLRGR